MTTGLLSLLAFALATPPAYAVKEFFNEFEAYYVKRNSKRRNDVVFANAVEQAKCTICHPGDDKHKLTGYGSQVAQIVNRGDKNDKKRIRAAFDEVSRMASDRYNKRSPTFGSMIKLGKIPAEPTR